MKITFLGTGTSQGVPMLGCRCYVCRSDNPKNKRRRASLLITLSEDRSILIDCGPDFREQALRVGLKSLECVLLTHTHADHIFGLDDLRPFNYWQGDAIPILLSAEDEVRLKKTFHYAFDPNAQIGGGLPQFALKVVGDNFSVDELDFEVINVKHGQENVRGYRFNDVAYLTDCKSIPQNSLKKLNNLEILIISAIWFKKHGTHMNIAEALDLVDLIKPKRTFFTHITHSLEHDIVQSILPDNVFMAYDGLQV